MYQLNKANHIAARPTAKAVPQVFLGIDGKRWGGIFMEGAEAPVVLADLFQLNAAGLHERNQLNAVFDGLYFVLTDHGSLSSYLAGQTAYL
jgi:hypothetical protein